MKKCIILLIIFIFPIAAIAQEWYRFDYTLSITDTIDNTVVELTPEIIKEHDYQMYALTSSYSGIRKFYYDQNHQYFRIVSEVMAEMSDPYLIIAREDSLMGLLMVPAKIKEKGNKVVDAATLKYKPGLFKIDGWENTGKPIAIYFKDDPSQRKLKATKIRNIKFTADPENSLKTIDKNYDYAYPFMGIDQDKPEGKKVYNLDIF